MTDSNSSNDAFNDSLSFIKNLWTGMGVPGMQSMGMSIPTLSLDDLDKRIQELKSVEAWLNVNITMLQNAIRALEIQRATVAALHSISASMSQSMQGARSDEASQSDQVDENNEDANQKQQENISPLLSQSAVWWNDMQEQFKQALEAALAKNVEHFDAMKTAAENMPATSSKSTVQSTTKSASKSKSGKSKSVSKEDKTE